MNLDKEVELMWARLGELDRTDGQNMRQKAEMLEVLAGHGLTLEAIANEAKKRDIKSVASNQRVKQLLGWHRLLTSCEEDGVPTTVGSERALRLIVSSGLTLADQVEVVAQIDAEGSVASALDWWRTNNGTWLEDEVERREACAGGETVVANLERDLALLAWARRNDLMQKVDRSSSWGNPYVLDADGDRDEVCDLYERYLLTKRSLNPNELGGKVLACWCYPLRCHGNHLADLANR
jgi:hypothetical protein